TILLFRVLSKRLLLLLRSDPDVSIEGGTGAGIENSKAGPANVNGRTRTITPFSLAPRQEPRHGCTPAQGQPIVVAVRRKSFSNSSRGVPFLVRSGPRCMMRNCSGVSSGR